MLHLFACIQMSISNGVMLTFHMVKRLIFAFVVSCHLTGFIKRVVFISWQFNAFTKHVLFSFCHIHVISYFNMTRQKSPAISLKTWPPTKPMKINKKNVQSLWIFVVFKDCSTKLILDFFPNKKKKRIAKSEQVSRPLFSDQDTLPPA